MTAFEILLTKFYDTLEKNEPELSTESQNSPELFESLKQYIETSFSYGQNLSYSKRLNELAEKIVGLFHNSSHEAWAKVMYTFAENNLDVLRHDRDKSEIADLKTKLVHSF